MTTIEGLSQGERLHPVQEAFVRCDALQCGFCTPGMIMQTKYLLSRNPDMTAEDAERGLEGNVCRCTGYKKIIAAAIGAGTGARD